MIRNSSLYYILLFGTFDKSFGTFDKSFGTFDKSFGAFDKSFGAFNKSFGAFDKSFGTKAFHEVAIGPAGGLGYIRARVGSRCVRISGTYT